jgi:hypothetical protein
MTDVSALLIRADADPKSGTGHVMRMLALAQAWNRRGGEVIFASIHHWASTLNPYHWLFIIGGMLVLMVLLREQMGRALSARLNAFKRTVSSTPAGTRA